MKRSPHPAGDQITNCPDRRKRPPDGRMQNGIPCLLQLLCMGLRCFDLPAVFHPLMLKLRTCLLELALNLP